MKKKWQISRRRMLKGMGACIALPFLEAMALPGANTSAYGNSPLRTGFCLCRMGFIRIIGHRRNSEAILS